MTKTRNYGDVLRRELADDPGLADLVEKEALAANIASEIYNARTRAGLTQGQLAEKAQTHQSVIARMEDADYNGHSVSMLYRIARAVGQSIHIEFRRKFTEDFIESGFRPSISVATIPIGFRQPSTWNPKINEIPGRFQQARAS